MASERRNHHRDRDPSRYREASTVEQLTEQNVKAILELDQASRASRSFTQRAAHRIASFCGSPTFLCLHVVWFGVWIAVNSLPGFTHLDPFPFTFLTLLVSLEAIFLSTFILISQNEETRLAERRNALDLQINLLTEQENTKMLQLLAAIARKLDIKLHDDGTLAVLEQVTRPEKLAEQIDKVSGDA